VHFGYAPGMSKPDRFLKACRREPVDVTPIWLMRQAGRYMAAYRKLRQRHHLLELVKTPELATAVTLQPIQAFDLDAAIIFADILPVVEAMGLNLRFDEGRGPVIEPPLLAPSNVEALVVRPPEEALGFTLEAIRLVSEELAGHLPLIGFSGAPFTLACYAIEGGTSADFARARRFMREDPPTWHKLMGKLSQAVGEYLRAQVEAGADALQLFDSWVGVLDEREYRDFVFPHSRDAIQRARHPDKPVPLIHFGTQSAHLLPMMKEAGGDVIGIDWRTDLIAAWQQLGNGVAVQGNLDPHVLLTSVPDVEREAAKILDRVNGRRGHIFNLGHGVLKDTPEDHVAALVAFVHEYRQG